MAGIFLRQSHRMRAWLLVLANLIVLLGLVLVVRAIDSDPNMLRQIMVPVGVSLLVWIIINIAVVYHYLICPRCRQDGREDTEAAWPSHLELPLTRSSCQQCGFDFTKPNF